MYTGNHGAREPNPNVFDDPLTFPLVIGWFCLLVNSQSIGSFNSTKICLIHFIAVYPTR